MNIKELNSSAIHTTDSKLTETYSQFEQLLHELRKRELPENIKMFVNKCVDRMNASPLTGTPLTQWIKQQQTAIIKQMEKALKVVPINDY